MSNTIVLPGKFCDWFSGTGLAQAQDDSDPECKETRLAYEDGSRVANGEGRYYIKVQATPTVLRVIGEYGEYCLEANRDDPIKSEQDAARKVNQRVKEAQQKMKEKVK